jgi:hypothetical protein
LKSQKIVDNTGSGFVRGFSTDNVENVNPHEYFRNLELQKRAIQYRDMLFAKNPYKASLLTEDFFLKHAEESLEGFFEKFEQVKLGENLKKLLPTQKKNEQEKLLKGATIDTNQLMALILKAHSDHGYLFSRVMIENLPNSLDKKKFPEAIHKKDDGSIEVIGETDLTEGEIRHIFNQRKVTVANFLEKDGFWHCLFITYNSIDGRENWRDGQAHFHYMSSSFGISKEEFIESIRSGNYKSTPIHIPLTDYGNQTGKAEKKND